MDSMTIEKTEPFVPEAPASHEQVEEELGGSLVWWMENREEIRKEAGLDGLAIAPEDTLDRREDKRPGCDFAFECRKEGRMRNMAVWLAQPGEICDAIAARAAKADAGQPPMTRRAEASPRPNDRCPCGSGRKYKRCCER